MLVNEWLSLNRNIAIMDTNMASIATGNKEEGKLSFYILYNTRKPKPAEAIVIEKEYQVPIETVAVKPNIEGLGN